MSYNVFNRTFSSARYLVWHKFTTIPNLIRPYLPVIPKMGVDRAWFLGGAVLLLARNRVEKSGIVGGS